MKFIHPACYFSTYIYICGFNCAILYEKKTFEIASCVAENISMLNVNKTYSNVLVLPKNAQLHLLGLEVNWILMEHVLVNAKSHVCVHRQHHRADPSVLS